MGLQPSRTRVFSIVLVLVAVMLVVPGTAAQQTRTGGNVVVQEGETVQGLTTAAGTVTVRGTVDGDLTVFAGDVTIAGNVTGETTIFGGSTTISGTVDRNTTVFGGYVELAETGRVGHDFAVFAGDVILNGTVGNDARVDAERLAVGPSARIGGNLLHATQTLSLSNQSQVTGEIRNVDRVDVGQGTPLQTNVPFWAFAIYGFLANLLLGAVLLLLLPGFSRSVADTARRRPLFTTLLGLLAMIIIPVILVLLAITIVGIPLTLIGGFLFLLALWAASVYGALGIGAGVMGALNTTNRWLALVAGLLIVFLLGAIPFVGGLVHLLVMLLGLGAITSQIW